MQRDFRQKFITYLTEGIDIHIPDDEVYMFYEHLGNFINNADNSFDSFYSMGEDQLAICDSYMTYLLVKYANNKIQFRKTSDLISKDPRSILRGAQAFVGVLLFIESLSPTIDGDIIPEAYHDQWRQL